MINNITALMSEYAWLVPAATACILASIMSGLIGSFVVARKMNNAAGGIAHIVLGGAGVAFYFGLPLLAGSFVVGVIGALLIGLIAMRLPNHEDLAINALWSMSMAGGIILITKSNVGAIDFSAYLFGNVLLASSEDLYAMLWVLILVFISITICWRAFLALSFDSEFTESRGLPVKWLNQLMLILVAITVVALVRVVGIVFVVALLTVPVAITQMFVHTLKKWIIWSIILNLIASTFGLLLAYHADLPIGASVVVTLGGFYWLSLFFLSIRRH